MSTVFPPSSVETLVIALHGGGGNVSSFESYSKLTDEVNATKRFGVVYPVAIDNHWNDGRSELELSSDDVGFIEKIIDTYREDGYSKFYVVGMSNGGVMAQRIACELGSKINGIAVVAATQSTVLQGSCLDRNAMDVMFVFGSEDSAFVENGDIVNPLVPSQIRGHHIGIDATLEYWLGRNLCLDFLSLEKTLDTKDDNTVVELYAATACVSKVAYFKVEDGGHRWPDPEAINWLPAVKFASHEISTAKEIVNFFGL